MAKKAYTIHSAAQRLANVRCGIDRTQNTGRVVIPSAGIGIKSWGAADYLRRQGYEVVFQDTQRRIAWMQPPHTNVT